MSGNLTGKTPRAAHDAAYLLYGNHLAPGADPDADAIKLSTPRADNTRGTRGKPDVGVTLAGA